MVRWLMLVVLLGALSVSAYHRAVARRQGETIARSREGALYGPRSMCPQVSAGQPPS
jgi:hypothetical protein